METNVYWLWLLSMGSLIFLMQAGFFLLEGGQVRSRDVTNVMMKMTGHLGIGIIVFLVGGFAIKQYGWPLLHMPNGWHLPWQFIGDGGQSITFYVSLMFALVSCAIPSGSFSGRMKFSAYLLFAALYVGIVYPVFAYILWNGVLARMGVQDYAGSLGVHAVGGIVGLVGASFLGQRRVRTSGHDVPMMGFGALLLMFCWFGFNLGSVPSYGNIAADLPLVAINTLAAIAGGIMGSLAGTLDTRETRSDRHTKRWVGGRGSNLLGRASCASAVCNSDRCNRGRADSVDGALPRKATEARRSVRRWSSACDSRVNGRTGGWIVGADDSEWISRIHGSFLGPGDRHSGGDCLWRDCVHRTVQSGGLDHGIARHG